MLKPVPARAESPPRFDPAFRSQFTDLLAWRRDVRRFRTDAVPEVLLASVLDLAAYAPSVGNCQPTRFVRVSDAARRSTIVANFEAANASALKSYDGERAALYATLKLAGLREAPIHLAVFCDEGTSLGFGLGARTMPQMRRYSSVCALHTIWLAARMHGLGVGWVSIFDPTTVNASLDVPTEWSFIAYLCIGWPQEEHLTPELERAGWQPRVAQHLVER
jgi:5,6-dimethylbenzimidazole synthase